MPPAQQVPQGPHMPQPAPENAMATPPLPPIPPLPHVLGGGAGPSNSTNQINMSVIKLNLAYPIPLEFDFPYTMPRGDAELEGIYGLRIKNAEEYTQQQLAQMETWACTPSMRRDEDLFPKTNQLIKLSSFKKNFATAILRYMGWLSRYISLPQYGTTYPSLELVMNGKLIWQYITWLHMRGLEETSIGADLFKLAWVIAYMACQVDGLTQAEQHAFSQYFKRLRSYTTSISKPRPKDIMRIMQELKYRTPAHQQWLFMDTVSKALVARAKGGERSPRLAKDIWRAAVLGWGMGFITGPPRPTWITTLSLNPTSQHQVLFPPMCDHPDCKSRLPCDGNRLLWYPAMGGYIVVLPHHKTDKSKGAPVHQLIMDGTCLADIFKELETWAWMARAKEHPYLYTLHEEASGPWEDLAHTRLVCAPSNGHMLVDNTNWGRTWRKVIMAGLPDSMVCAPAYYRHQVATYIRALEEEMQGGGAQASHLRRVMEDALTEAMGHSPQVSLAYMATTLFEACASWHQLTQVVLVAGMGPPL